MSRSNYTKSIWALLGIGMSLGISACGDPAQDDDDDDDETSEGLMIPTVPFDEESEWYLPGIESCQSWVYLESEQEKMAFPQMGVQLDLPSPQNRINELIFGIVQSKKGGCSASAPVSVYAYGSEGAQPSATADLIGPFEVQGGAQTDDGVYPFAVELTEPVELTTPYLHIGFVFGDTTGSDKACLAACVDESSAANHASWAMNDAGSWSQQPSLLFLLGALIEH